nr:cytochrome c biogenesis FC, mitochondrial [Tanacetum cinerariifolium]
MDGGKSRVLVRASRPVLLRDIIGRNSSETRARKALFIFVRVLHFLLIEKGDFSYLESFCDVLRLLFFRTFFSLPRERSAGLLTLLHKGIYMVFAQKMEATELKRLRLDAPLVGIIRFGGDGISFLHELSWRETVLRSVLYVVLAFACVAIFIPRKTEKAEVMPPSRKDMVLNKAVASAEFVELPYRILLEHIRSDHGHK